MARGAAPDVTRFPRSSRLLAFLTLAALGACAGPVPSLPPAVAAAQDDFPAGYEQSRLRFRSDCVRSAAVPSAACRRFPVPVMPCGAPRDAGDDLTIDTAFFPSRGDRLLVVQSGIHGAEAPAGAAVQRLLMERYLGALLVGGTDVLLVHAVDAWGFRHRRRTNGCNVNLNRNFGRDGSLYATANPDYDRLRPVVEPEGPVASPRLETLKIAAALVATVAADGFSSRRVLNGLNSGQFRHPEGLNYGGQEPAPENLVLRDVLRPHLARPYRSVLLLDVHTGLGEPGVLAVIEGVAPAPARMQALRALLEGADPGGIVFRTGQDPGFFPTAGDVIDAVPALAPDPSRVLAVTMEYGTFGGGALAQLRSAAALVLENRRHRHGCATEEACAEVASRFRGLFDPPDAGWRAQVLRRAGLVFERLAGGRW
ncbi:MAG: DUF2817 domain-containing protein [Acetobacteraceae bacterium]|nr:DUF2817 domain-containing protein [Acetobacteraceae bacterium]